MKAQYQSAVLISGLFTFFAAYFSFWIFDSGEDASTYAGGCGMAPVSTSVPFNDAYRYSDGLLTGLLMLVTSLSIEQLETSLSSPCAILRTWFLDCVTSNWQLYPKARPRTKPGM